MERGYIHPSKLPYGAPMLFVGKKDEKLKMCIDYRTLNKITIKKNYPLPRIDDLFNKLNGVRYFNWINLKSRYYQIHIVDEDVKKTTMRTHDESYEFLVMSFELCNAPSTFTTLMNLVFHDKLDKFLIIYIDGIFIYSKLAEEHTRHLEYVLHKLKENNLYANKAKSEFAQMKMDFLGHVFSLKGIRLNSKKVQAIKEWQNSVMVKGIRSFLRNFYKKFIAGFSALAKPLTGLLNKELSFEWREEQKKALGC